jgi:hypothetical protein
MIRRKSYWVQILLEESATSTWQEILQRYLGMKMKMKILDRQQSIIGQSLCRALARPHQQFAILLSSSSDDDDDNWMEFPTYPFFMRRPRMLFRMSLAIRTRRSNLDAGKEL